MRCPWLILFTAALPVSVWAQNQRSFPSGIVSRDFSVTDSACGYEHGSPAEKVLQTVKIVIDTTKSSGVSPVVTLRLRNNSAKTITAYVFNYTLARGGKIDYYDGHGADLIYEMAIAKSSQGQALPNATFPPGGVIKQEIDGGRGLGQFEVYPCMVAFDDGTFLGPPFLFTFLMQMRADNAKAFGAIITDLKSARDSADPKTFLNDRVKRVRKSGRSAEERYRYLEIVASALSPSGNTPLDKKAIVDFISGLEAEEEMLASHSTIRKRE